MHARETLIQTEPVAQVANSGETLSSLIYGYYCFTLHYPVQAQAVVLTFLSIDVNCLHANRGQCYTVYIPRPFLHQFRSRSKPEHQQILVVLLFRRT